MMMHCERSTRRLSPRVSVALSRMPSNKLPERVGGLFDFVEQKNREFELVGVPLVQRFLRQQGMRLAVTEVARRRTDQFGDFMGVLELGAVDLDAGAGIAEKRFGQGFDDAGLARIRWAQGRAGCRPGDPGAIQAGQEHLVDLDDFLDGGVLANDFTAESSFEVAGIAAATRRVENRAGNGLHSVALISLWAPCLGAAAQMPGMTFFVTVLSCPGTSFG